MQKIQQEVKRLSDYLTKYTKAYFTKLSDIDLKQMGLYGILFAI